MRLEPRGREDADQQQAPVQRGSVQLDLKVVSVGWCQAKAHQGPRPGAWHRWGGAQAGPAHHPIRYPFLLSPSPLDSDTKRAAFSTIGDSMAAISRVLPAKAPCASRPSPGHLPPACHLPPATWPPAAPGRAVPGSGSRRPARHAGERASGRAGGNAPGPLAGARWKRRGRGRPPCRGIGPFGLGKPGPPAAAARTNSTGRGAILTGDQPRMRRPCQ